MAGHELYSPDEVPAGGIVTGIGKVKGYGTHTFEVNISLIHDIAVLIALSLQMMQQSKVAHIIQLLLRSTFVLKKSLNRIACLAFTSVMDNVLIFFEI